MLCSEIFPLMDLNLNLSKRPELHYIFSEKTYDISPVDKCIMNIKASLTQSSIFYFNGEIRQWATFSFIVCFGVLMAASTGCKRSNRTATPHPAGTFLSDQTIASSSYPGIIKKSEVVMRGLRSRPIDAKDSHNTLDAIRGFHATRIEWIYDLTPEFVRQVKRLGASVSGKTSTSTSLQDPKSPEAAKKFGILDLNLKPTTATWMRSFNGLWICINNPEARESTLAALKRQYDLGLRDINRDDPKANEHAVRWGACFCPHCMKGFREYLRANCTGEELRKLGVEDIGTFDYRQYLLAANAPAGDAFLSYNGGALKEYFTTFQREATIGFHKWWREELNKHAGHYVPASCNNNGRDYDGTFEPFDFYVGELKASDNNPSHFFKTSLKMKELGKGQTFTMPLAPDVTATPEWIRKIRTAIAGVYANGLHMEVPWDTYLPAPHAPRFFGESKDFSDLFAMVRASAGVLDGYEGVAAAGMDLSDPRWSASDIPVSISPPSAPATAFVRAKPGDRNAPVVIHLIDWSASPGPFTLSLRPEAFFGGSSFRAVLLTPVPYKKEQHAAAFDFKDYEKLVRRTVLGEGMLSSLKIPALVPWGIVVLEPLAGCK